MKLPDSLVETKIGLCHQAEEIITDFTGYREVKVRSADPSMIGAEPNECIWNSLELARYDDLDVVQGYISIDEKIGIFHYWNWCPENKVYWDATPIDSKMRYWIKL